MPRQAKPLAITMGDAAGVGPEILLRYFAETETPAAVIFGDLAILQRASAQLGIPMPGTDIVEPDRLDLASFQVGQVQRATGQAARSYIVAATQATLHGDTNAVVTLPVNKEAVQLSDPHFVGHTELIAELCGADDVTMMLANPRLLVTHVSTHVSLREAIQRVTTERVFKVIELTWAAALRVHAQPRIAVCGLNPHAGEGGLFGTEDSTIIAPAVREAKAQGLTVDGPFPADTLFYQAVHQRRFDAVICMYHDQGHAPMKLLDFEGTVNVTLGLPIIRTSVDHGTAFDIAWQGKASTKSFGHAIRLARSLVG